MRGRPKLTDSERLHRTRMCQALAQEIKTKSGLSSQELTEEFGFSNSRRDGRSWRAIAEGVNILSPLRFKQITQKAARNGWLEDFGWLRYATYWSPAYLPENECFVPDGDYEGQWRDLVFSRSVMMLLAHATRCGVSHDRFFADAHKVLDCMQNSQINASTECIEKRARQIASSTVEDLLNGPEYPETSLSLN